MTLKVFDLKLLIGREQIIGDKRTCVGCVETNGRNLYLGMNDGHVHHYLLSVEESEETKSVKALQQTIKQVAAKKTISQIFSAPALNHVLVNCDGNLLLLNMLDLSTTSVPGKLKNINSFCVNRRPMYQNAFAVEICVSFHKKKSLQLFQVSQDGVVPMHEVSLPEAPKSFRMDGKSICVATMSAYFIINCETGSRQELISIGDNCLSMVCNVAISEFLIAASNALGVFVCADGTSNRPPLQWSDGVFDVAVTEPYLAALNDEFLTIHSLLDQQQKQSIPIRGGNLVSDCIGGSILLCTPKDLMILIPVSLETQLQDLFSAGNINDAISLIKSSKKRLTKSKYTNLWNRVCCTSGFIEFSKFDFPSAQSFFEDGSMDPRELIALFPGLLPSLSTFNPTVPAFHSLSNVQQLCGGDRLKLKDAKEFLAAYLVVVCNKNNKDLSPDVVFATVLILAELGKGQDAQSFIERKSGKNCRILETLDQPVVEELGEKLSALNCHHLLALVHLYSGNFEDAMKIWRSIVTCGISDDSFPGVEFVVSEISKHSLDATLVWKNADWVLGCNQHWGAQLFIDIFNKNKESLNPDNVVSFLHNFPLALREYLHHLVVISNVQKEKFHTHLAVLYLEHVLELVKSQGDEKELKECRAKLQEMLTSSDLYRVHLILNKVQEVDLYKEQVILHGKLSKHDKALEILVHNIKDPIAAKQYCLNQGENDDKFRKQLFHNLLSVYFSDISATRGSSGSVGAAINILNDHPHDFNWESVLHLIPTNWSVSLLQNFLEHVLRDRLHNSRTGRLHNSLAKAQMLQLHREKIHLHSRPVIVDENRICHVCSRLIADQAFARYPNGIVIHARCCKDKHVCPVTGKVFKMSQRSKTFPEILDNDK